MAATNAFPLRGRWHEVTDEVFKIVNQYVCHKPVGGGLSSADSVKSQNDCHRQSATPTAHTHEQTAQIKIK